MNIMSSTDQSLPRQMTAVGTMGEMGQLFTVYEKNWICKDCNQENYSSRPRCFRCKKQKPIGEKNYVLDPAVEAAKSGKVIAWQEVVDPATYQIYYYNKESGLTQWERPEEMGPAPMATGWFGRGVAGSTAAQRYKQSNDHYLQRPARKQKDFIDPKKYHTEGANEYNIWYGKFIGDLPEKGAKQEAATDRCVLETDAGATKADSGGGGRKDKRFFCVHFAHGVCAKGKDCVYYHRIPTPDDDARCDELFDCFGRQRHSSHRDDMTGVGSFMKPCRTLFVANLLKHKYGTPKELEDALWKHFDEWGELESLNVIMRLSIAFPRYRLRTSAEFAKEAMQGQALDHNEIMSIRWAHDDPNPVAQDSISRADRDALTGLLNAKGISTTAAPYEYPADYQVPDAKRLRLENGADVATDHPDIAYPNTDTQYTSQSSAAALAAQYGMTQEQYAAYCEAYYANQYGIATDGSTDSVIGNSTQQEHAIESSSSGTSASEVAGAGVLSSYLTDLLKPSETSLSSESSKKTEQDGSSSKDILLSGWTEYIDDDTGATYYYHAESGESSWEVPTV